MDQYDEGELEVIDLGSLSDNGVGQSDVGVLHVAPPLHEPRGRRPSTALAAVGLSCVLAVASAALAWQMRHQRDAAILNSRADLVAAKRELDAANTNAQELRDQLVNNRFGQGAAIAERYVGSLNGVHGGQVTLLLANIVSPAHTTFAVLHISGEPRSAFGFIVSSCGQASSPPTSEPSSENVDSTIPLQILNHFPFVDRGNFTAVHILEWAPPPGQTPDGVSPVDLGGVRGPFGSQTKLARGVAGCG